MVVGGITVSEIQATVYDEETDQLTEVNIGPTHDRQSLRRIKKGFERGLNENQKLIESRKDTITRGLTERLEEYYNEREKPVSPNQSRRSKSQEYSKDETFLILTSHLDSNLEYRRIKIEISLISFGII